MRIPAHETKYTNQLSEGTEYLLVNGVTVIPGGKMTDAFPGKDSPNGAGHRAGAARAQ
jgi:hypothetical protein